MSELCGALVRNLIILLLVLRKCNMSREMIRRCNHRLQYPDNVTVGISECSILIGQKAIHFPYQQIGHDMVAVSHKKGLTFDTATLSVRGLFRGFGRSPSVGTSER